MEVLEEDKFHAAAPKAPVRDCKALTVPSFLQMAPETRMLAPEAASEAPGSCQLRSSVGTNMGLIADSPAATVPIVGEKSRRKRVRCKQYIELLRGCKCALELPGLEPGWAMLLVTTTVSLVVSSG